jgi:hypothetical protein
MTPFLWIGLQYSASLDLTTWPDALSGVLVYPDFLFCFSDGKIFFSKKGILSPFGGELGLWAYTDRYLPELLLLKHLSILEFLRSNTFWFLLRNESLSIMLDSIFLISRILSSNFSYFFTGWRASAKLTSCFSRLGLAMLNSWIESVCLCLAKMFSLEEGVMSR